MGEKPTTWWEIILENWAQITVLLGAVGYILKTMTDWKFKKNEISFSKIQEAKILEIKSFYKSYQALEISLRIFINQTEFGEHSTEIFNKIRERIRECLVDFEFNCMTVKLFIERSEMKTVDDISKVCDNIRIDIERWHIYKDSQNPPDGWDKLDEIRNDKLTKTLPYLIKRIESSLRKSYNID
jgi:hypothetical protein